MLVFGRNVAKEMLKNPKNIKSIILQDSFDDKNIISLIEKDNLNYKYMSKREIDHLIDGVHQGIILDIMDYKYYNLNDIINSNDSFIVIIDHIEDPHNLGAIIRTCEAAGVDSIIIPKDRQVGITGTVMKTSVGTVNDMKIVRVSNLANTIDKLKKNNFWIVGTALENSVDYRDIDYSGKIGLVVGNEGSGMSRIVKEKCDFIAKIPMYGKTNSLNASVALGIMVYEVVRNRK
ncbi:MAG: 23S rRNA (guanosine(2251)-2'-O)-methyltransferase RlmB [Bacilli bacterium]|nr:23S rRNA (guanosine(2251)-2'-O)-methyltransferase RlmB [Bacilli bacterium]